MSDIRSAVRERLIRYAKVHTTSDRIRSSRPTTACQFDLAKMLAKELTDLGASDVYLSESCVLYAGIEASRGCENAEPLGLIVHMDTAPDASGEHVRPKVVPCYDGGDLCLNEEQKIYMKPSDFPVLNSYIGQELVVTDGTTLLGGDDKAGIAAVMTMVEVLLAHPKIPHGPIRLAFTPDEEVGGLARDLDLERFGSPTAYTLDGEGCGVTMEETFNASQADITFFGRSVHTGTAKGVLVNASELAMEFWHLLPQHERPEFTEGREGFFHLVSMSGSCEEAHLSLIVRDHDEQKFAKREEMIRAVVSIIQKRHGMNCCQLTLKETYRSMKQVIDRFPKLMEHLNQAITDCGIAPKALAFRGGTDGSALSWRGLPCPNLSAGYENAHGRFEFVSVDSMEKNVEILLRLAAILAEERSKP